MAVLLYICGALAMLAGMVMGLVGIVFLGGTERGEDLANALVLLVGSAYISVGVLTCVGGVGLVGLGRLVSLLSGIRKNTRANTPVLRQLDQPPGAPG